SAAFVKLPASSHYYPLSLHDALPIYRVRGPDAGAGQHGHYRLRDHRHVDGDAVAQAHALRPEHVREAADLLEELPVRDRALVARDRKSTRLNSSHVKISYAVFCLKKK